MCLSLRGESPLTSGKARRRPAFGDLQVAAFSRLVRSYSIFSDRLWLLRILNSKKDRDLNQTTSFCDWKKFMVTSSEIML